MLLVAGRADAVIYLDVRLVPAAAVNNLHIRLVTSSAAIINLVVRLAPASAGVIDLDVRLAATRVAVVIDLDIRLAAAAVIDLDICFATAASPAAISLMFFRYCCCSSCNR